MFEPDETFFVNLSNPTNATIADGQGQGTITNDDPQPTISIGMSFRTEGASGTSANATFNVNLSNPSYQTITVHTLQRMERDSGQRLCSDVRNIHVQSWRDERRRSCPMTGDNIDETNETYVVNLSNPTNATIATAQGAGTIMDDDGPTLSIGNASVTEGNTGFVNAVFTVTLSAAERTRRICQLLDD